VGKALTNDHLGVLGLKFGLLAAELLPREGAHDVPVGLFELGELEQLFGGRRQGPGLVAAIGGRDQVDNTGRADEGRLD
jgi:hypothetical protein